MRAGFSEESAAHCIEELIFDCSFDSMAIAQTFETDMNGWLTTQLLPVIDSVFREFDETGVVWRMDQLELDLGDIPEDNFYDVLVQRLREKLSERLHAQQNKTPGTGLKTAVLPSARRITQLQSDLEQLRDFLLTGTLPWHIDAKNQQAHEAMLQRVLQSENAGELLITLLRRLPADERAISVRRLISQFPQQHLENLLFHMTPAHAAMLADFMRVYRQALIEHADLQTSHAEKSIAAWTHLFEFLLSTNQLPDHPTALLRQLIDQNAINRPWQKPHQLVRQLIETAAQWKKSGKIDDVLCEALQALYTEFFGRKPVAILPGNAAARRRSARRALIERETPAARVIAALSGMGPIGEPAHKWTDQEPAAFRRELQKWLSAAAVRTEVLKLPIRLLQDIHFVLSEQAALIMEDLLGYSDKLYKLKHEGGELSRAQWQQKLWMASLTYWSSQPGTALEPLTYLQALARGVTDQDNPQKLLRAWLTALQRTQSHGTLVTQLQMSMATAPGRQTARGKAAAFLADEVAEGVTVHREQQQQPQTGEIDTAQRQLRQHLQAMPIKQPEQLQQFYQELRRGRHDLTAMYLHVNDLRNLIEGLLRTESAASNADRQLFLQSIDQQAMRITDQRGYYRNILEAMLQNREIDVEAIAASVQRDAESGSTGGKEISTSDTSADIATAGQAAPLKAAPPTPAQPGSGTDWQTEAAYHAVYEKIMRGLQKIGLLKEIARFSATGMRVAQIQQRLRELLSSMELDELAGKLPPALALDLVYLLQPQAARIMEHLLAQGTALHGIAGEEAALNQAQWAQRIRRGAIAYCLTEADREFESTIYLHTLARAVSASTDSGETLLAWYEQLEQIKAYGASHAMLQTINNLSQVVQNSISRTPTVASSHVDKINQETATQPAVSAGALWPARQRQLERETPAARVIAALSGMGPIGEPAHKWTDQEPAAFRRELQKWLSAAAVRTEVLKLPIRLLQDIHFVLSEQAALIMEDLLGYSDKLYKLKHEGGELSRAQWQQKLWMASLTYWSSQPGTALEPLTYLQALARGVTDQDNPQKLLRAWLTALQRTQSHGTLVTQLQMSMATAPGRQTARGKAAAFLADEVAEGVTVHREQQQQPQTGEIDTAQRQLRQHLQAMPIKQPEQLQQFYQELRRGRHDLTAMYLHVNDLRNLIEGLLRTESAASNADRQLFLQSIDQQAMRITDQRGYYRNILEAMLQNREIDVEAIAASVQRDAESGSTGGKEISTSDTSADIATAGQAAPLKAAPPTPAQPGSGTDWQTEAAYHAVYEKIMRGLQKIGLLKEIARFSATGMRVAQIQQRLRELLSSMELDELAGKLPPALALDLVYLLQPQAARIMEHLLAQGTALHGIAGEEAALNQAQWAQRIRRGAIAYCLTEADREFESTIYLHTLARAVSASTDSGETLLAWYEQLEQIKAYGALHAMLQRMILQSTITSGLRAEANGSQNPAVNNATELASPEAFPAINWDSLLKGSQSGDVYEEIFIDNSGMILAAPYLPRLFTLLELVNDGVFVNRQAAERAVHLLQFLVNEQLQSPEYQLTLNKILCGITTGIPICREIEINDREQETIEGLLRGMIQNWKTVGNTSISGLRETFLQRKGVLQLKEDGLWYLTVEPGVFDMLLDSLPWSFSVIKHAWMEHAVHVTWR